MAYTVIAEAVGNASTTAISAATHFTNQQYEAIRMDVPFEGA